MSRDLFLLFHVPFKTIFCQHLHSWISCLSHLPFGQSLLVLLSFSLGSECWHLLFSLLWGAQALFKLNSQIYTDNSQIWISSLKPPCHLLACLSHSLFLCTNANSNHPHLKIWSSCFWCITKHPRIYWCTTILLCPGIPWVRNSDKAQERWLASGPQCLGLSGDD